MRWRHIAYVCGWTMFAISAFWSVSLAARWHTPLPVGAVVVGIECGYLFGRLRERQ